MGETKKAYGILVQRSLEKLPFGRLKRRRKDNIKMILWRGGK
jgi:hypothetical protein